MECHYQLTINLKKTYLLSCNGAAPALELSTLFRFQLWLKCEFLKNKTKQNKKTKTKKNETYLDRFDQQIVLVLLSLCITSNMSFSN